jgi:hypothetical protein
MAKRINEREALFIAYYQAEGETNLNATESARKAGYSPKSCPQIGSQLLRKPKIREAIQKHIDSKRADITKKDYVDMAIKDYKELSITEANKPRFLDIAGKALGYIGNNQDARPNQSLTLINVDMTGKTQEQLWDMTRKLLAEQSQS